MTDAIESLLAPFAEPEVQALQRFCATGAHIVPAHSGLRAFRSDPAAALDVLWSVMDELWRTAAPLRRVAWFASGDPATGLDDFELAALLGRHMHVEQVYQAADGTGKHVVAVGTLRNERVGISVVALGVDRAVDLLDALTVHAGAAPIVFVSNTTAADLIATSRGIGRVKAYQQQGGELGLLVPADRSASALADPEREVGPVRTLAGRTPLFVRFAASRALTAGALHAFMTRAGIACDTSLIARDGQASASAIARQGPYSESAPYRPQPFDLRVPLMRADPADWFVLPRVAVAAPEVRRWWTEHQGPSDDALAPLLDAARIQAFARLSRVRRSEERRYPDVRIYNWPAPAPSSRVTLLDAGAATAGAVAELVAALAALGEQSGPSLGLVAGQELVRLAREEMGARYSTTDTAAIALQTQAHGYLAHIPQDAPLRADYADFARFVPGSLGKALEIGSGYGLLAWALAPRARGYTCLDLDREMFRSLRPDLGQAGVVADMHRLPFGGAVFDSIVANNVLEHLYDPLAGLTEIRRVLRPGGRLFALVPFDALNNRHELPAHQWKIDEPGVRHALCAAGLDVQRLEVVSLYDLGVGGAFPSCHGLVAKVDAVRSGSAAAPPPVHGATRIGSGSRNPGGALAGRLFPAVRELAGFERWAGRRVGVIASDPSDVDEFEHYGADVVRISADHFPLTVPDSSLDLVYAFLTLPAGHLSTFAEQSQRVLAPGGTVVAGFHHREGMRYLARVRSYFGAACALDDIADPDVCVQLADDGGAAVEADFVTRDEVDAAFSRFAHRAVTVRNLTPSDLPGAEDAQYESAFWTWLARACGRFVLLKAVK